MFRLLSTFFRILTVAGTSFRGLNHAHPQSGRSVYSVQLVLYTVVFSIWHVPSLYNLMMREHAFHIAMHLMVMATATLMWWPIVGGDGGRAAARRRRLRCSTCSCSVSP